MKQLRSIGDSLKCLQVFPQDAGQNIGAWRTDPRLQGKFSVPGYPDDLKVLIHDGGPNVANRPPELVYARVTGYVADVYRGRVLNRPHQLQTVKEGDLILLIVPVNSKWPIYINEKYLEERADWLIPPCGKCGFSELFDAPSDLIREQFPLNPLESTTMFTTRCPMCGEGLVLERVEQTGPAD